MELSATLVVTDPPAQWTKVQQARSRQRVYVMSVKTRRPLSAITSSVTWTTGAAGGLLRLAAGTGGRQYRLPAVI